MAIIDELRTAVSDEIDGASLSLPVITTREWVSPTSVEDLTDLRVVVMPEQLELNGVGLEPRVAVDWGVRVWVQQRVAFEDRDDLIPPLLGLCEDIGILFKPGRTLASPRARSISVQMRPAFDSKTLDEKNVFSSQIVIVFRSTRA